ncbi:hypothetical protein [Alcanivorax sp. DP30]|uniref:hypothetical protein n=1 Tax=Alcanivorax sp. DP30 TaxID=2606217 RepID=UPI00137137F2|nr:hypothetical protein [Alcanivorax sp. DP30]MZR64473.1 hypothetical protein [Alcanivorax sp. DP30]
MTFLLIAIAASMAFFWGAIIFFLRKKKWIAMAASVFVMPALCLGAGRFFPMVYQVNDCDSYQTGVLLFPKEQQHGWLFYGAGSYVQNRGGDSLVVFPIEYRRLVPGMNGAGARRDQERVFSIAANEQSHLPIQSITYTFAEPPASRGGDYRDRETIYVMECASRLSSAT